jgi:hypothetical protein
MTDQGNSPFLDMINEAINAQLRNLMVCLPGKVVSFDPETQMAQVECGIQKRINSVFRTIPVIDNVRVQFAGDGEWYFWHQVGPGTEGLIHFSQRAVDTWNDQGGPVAPHELRMFSAEDAYFVPGIRSTPRLIPAFVNEGVGIGSYDGATRLHLTPGQIKWEAGGQTLTLDSAGLKHNGTSVGDTHVHPQAPDSAGNAQQDTDPPK